MLNEEWLENIDALIDFLATPDGQNWCVEFRGYCSAAGTNKYNQLLSIDRATRVYEDVVAKVKAKGEAGPNPPLIENTSFIDFEVLSAGTDYYIYDENNFKSHKRGWTCRSTTDKKEDKRTSYRKGIDKEKGMDSRKCSDCYSLGPGADYYPYVDFIKVFRPEE